MIEATEQLDRYALPLDEHEKFISGSYCRKIKRPGDQDSSLCYSLVKDENAWRISTSYFIGVDWLDCPISSIRISPKFNHHDGEIEVNYLKMLEDALKEPTNFDHLDGLLYVDFNSPSINLPRQDDVLSLFIISEFIHVLARITEKGLKKSYYLKDENLHSKVKGKLLLQKNAKTNLVKGNRVDNYCRYQEYGIDIPENRLLKHALMLGSRLLDYYNENTIAHLKEIISSIRPSWKRVSDDFDSRLVQENRVNPFYKEYPIAIRLAKLILRRTSYNQVLHGVDMTSTPPYWIDMSKLFEMFVFSKLRERFGNNVIYHPHFRGQEPDYLLTSEGERPPFIIDAKYKRYGERAIETDDIRQVSGYSRLKSVRKRLGVEDHSLIPCMIIFPQHDSLNYVADYTNWQEEGRYIDVFKAGIELPIIQKQSLHNND